MQRYSPAFALARVPDVAHHLALGTVAVKSRIEGVCTDGGALEGISTGSFGHQGRPLKMLTPSATGVWRFHRSISSVDSVAILAPSAFSGPCREDGLHCEGVG